MRLALLSASLLVSSPALACGAFFCDRGVPMDQSAERIVFAIDSERNKVETHVQISYQGEADHFAWVVPVPGVPDVGLSSDALFQAVAGATQPYFWLQYRYDNCTFDTGGFDLGGGGGGVGGGGSNGGGGGGGGGGGIDILAEGQTGPYDWKVVSATSEDALRTWLGDPDSDPSTADAYDVPPGTSAKLAAYLDGGSNFIAFRLLPTATTGDIEPVKLGWPGDHATIPLTLTALAATPDLRLEVYVLGAHRAVPTNYLHVEIDLAAIDWWQNGSNYRDLITRAADEAGGHAFATDAFVETSSIYLTAPTSGQMADLKTKSDPIDFFNQLVQLGIPGNATTLALFRKYLPEPQSLVDQGVPDTQFYNCLACWPDALVGVSFDAAAFATELEEKVARPARDAAALVAKHRYVTRLTSSVSPDEMTLDPIFGFSPTMSDTLVSNYRSATEVVDCGGTDDWQGATHRLELPDGTSFTLPPAETAPDGYGAWLGGLGLPAAARIERTAEEGPPVPVLDNADTIAALLAGALPDDTDVAADTDASADTDGDDTPVEGSCGCDQTTPGAGVGLALLALALRRRRR